MRDDKEFMKAVLADEDFLAHYGVLGMKWGKRRSGSDIKKAVKDKKELTKSFHKQDKEWDKNFNKHAGSMLEKISNKPGYQKEATNLLNKLQKAGLQGKPLEDAYQSGIVKITNDHLIKDDASYNPSKTKVMVMHEVTIGQTRYVKPVQAEVVFEDDEDRRKILNHSIDVYPDDELYHYGVLGMKWGKRRGGVGITNKRQRAFDEKGLKALNDGKHLSTGFGKKRQQAFDERDKRALNKRLETQPKKKFTDTKLGSKYKLSDDDEEERRLVEGTPPTKKPKKQVSEDYSRAKALRKKSASEMSNNELRDVINRMQLEQQYGTLKKSNMSPAKKFVVDIMRDVGKETVKSAAKNGVNKLVKEAVTASKKKK